MRTRTAWLGVAAVLILVGCQGSVDDPPNDGTFGVDIVRASVDLRTPKTMLSIDYRNANSGASQKVWLISTDNDTIAEFEARIGTESGARSDIFTVRRPNLSPGQESFEISCRGFIEDGGFIDEDTAALTIDTRCLYDLGTGRLPDAVRMSAQSFGVGGRDHDETGWTAAVARS